MRIVAWLVAAILALAATACSTSKSSPGKSASPTSASAAAKTMPNVTGQKLDKAENAIVTAGCDPDKVKEIGGGKLGIVIKSNWTVCSQVPAAGEPLPATPQLTVKRSCASGSTAPSQSAPASAPPSSATPTTLTTSNSKDLAALLKGG